MTLTPTFDDEFNSLSLWNGTSGTWDTTAQYATWNGSGFSLPSNGEQEWYINSNYAPTSSVTPWTDNNGIMTLTAAPASAAIQSAIGGYQYTSGAINTSQSFSQTYGYFEMRAQLPAGQGLWPAFWLLPENGSWPPEIDAMEMLGNNPSVYYTSVHSGTAANEVSAGQADGVGDTSAGYHTFGVDWEPDFITYYFDGLQVYKVATPADMNVPMYMIANLAVGGAWPGNADATTPFPANMNVDWIRAYASLPSWVADGSDATDVGHTPASAVGSPGGGGTGGNGTGSGTTPTADWQPTYTVPTGVTNVVLTGTSAQTINANNLGDTITSNDFGSTLIGGTGNDTFIAGHGHDTMTGGAGSDTFTFNVLPWNAGHITDFTPGVDKLDLSGIFQTIDYMGTNPVADGYLSFVSDGAGNTQVYFDPHSASQQWPSLITTLDGVSPSSLSASDYIVRHSALPTATTIESAGSTSLVAIGSNYELNPATGGSGPTLHHGGSIVTAGEFGGWAPIGAEATGSGYEIAWKMAGQDQYTVWNTDSSGNYISNAIAPVSGSNSALESLETSFHQDLNGDGTIGVLSTTIESAGSTSLLAVANNYELNPVGGGSGPMLQHGGSVVTTGEFGGWTPISAEASAGGYEIAWKMAGQDMYTVWDADSSGNYLSNAVAAVSGSDSQLEVLETSFHQDLNGDGTIGVQSTTIESAGSTSLLAVANNYELNPVGGGSGPMLHFGGALVTAGEFGGWTPIGAEATGSGYEIAWKMAGHDMYTVWNADSSGNYLSNAVAAVSGSDAALQSLETSFHQDLNGDGTIGVTSSVIESSGSTSLTTLGNNYELNPVAGGSGPMLHFGGALVTSGEFGGWTPIAAEATAGGYEIAWKMAGQDLYTVWNTDSSGNYLSNAVGAVSGSDSVLQSLETSFHQDLNGDGTIGVHTAAASYIVPSGVQTVTLTGTSAQTVIANNLGDTITSNDYGSTLIGGAGNDTFIAGHGADLMSGGAGSDTFVFNVAPSSAGHISDFSPGIDKLDLNGLFTASGYTGTNPIADGYLSFVADGAGNTEVMFDPHSVSHPGATLITTLDHVSPASIAASDWIFHSA